VTLYRMLNPHHEPVWEPADLQVDVDGNTRPGYLCVYPLENGNGPCEGNVFDPSESVEDHSCVVYEPVSYWFVPHRLTYEEVEIEQAGTAWTDWEYTFDLICPDNENLPCPHVDAVQFVEAIDRLGALEEGIHFVDIDRRDDGGVDFVRIVEG
jgi:hypothetical protein